jgi:beta-phosphoglucomutase-like phosphatase (HAD superfamily)
MHRHVRAVARPKPAPDIFLRAATLLGGSPAQSLVFEDSPTGMQAAVAAGMRLVAVPDARLDRSRIPAGAVVVDSLAALDLAALGL